MGRVVRCSAAHEPDHGLLRTRRQRPYSRRAADKCDEFASPHRLALKQRVLPYHAVGCIVHHGKFWLPMSALGQKRTLRRVGPMSALPPKADINLGCLLCAISGHQFGSSGTDSTTLYAITGRRIPFSANSPTGSTATTCSTDCRTRGLTRIWAGLASSQRRDATLETVPIAA